MSDFYVYCYYEPDVDPEYGLPFYVGKGRGRRAYAHLTGCKRQEREGYHSLFYRKLRKMLSQGTVPEVEITIDMLTEEEAFAFECELIRRIGRRNLGRGPLCNLTDGGDGPSGYIMSEEARQRIRKAHLGKSLSFEHRQRLSEARSGKKHSEETRRRIGAGRCGKKHSEETKRHLSRHFRGKKHSEVTRCKMRESHLHRPVSSFDADDNLICRYDSIKAVSDGGFDRSNVSNCLAGRQKTHRGLTWRYTDA